MVSGRVATAAATVLCCLLGGGSNNSGEAKLADRSRLVRHRRQTGRIAGYHDGGRPIEGQSYRSTRRGEAEGDVEKRLRADERQRLQPRNDGERSTKQRAAPWKMPVQPTEVIVPNEDFGMSSHRQEEEQPRKLSSQLSGCCYNYESYTASSMCALYGNDCQSGETPSHDSGDGDCSQDGLSFIGISFSVNTASGNPYSYQLCDQFPMENIIDRDYEYVMSMDEDGWLVGGGYKTFDYSGKMP
jgi:hypothetical protein